MAQPNQTLASDKDKDKSLENAMAQIDRAHGKGAVMRLGDQARAPIEVIPTGATTLDIALGIGGLPRGRVVEIYGPESSGKTTVALHAIANAQKAGGVAAFIDAEHALDPEYAKRLGVDTDALLISQPDSGEQALEIADMLIRSGALDIIVIDSVAALVPRAEIDGEMGDSHVGLQARLMSQALRKMTGAINGFGTTAIFINQLREKIGVMFGSVNDSIWEIEKTLLFPYLLWAGIELLCIKIPFRKFIVAKAVSLWFFCLSYSAICLLYSLTGHGLPALRL